MVEGDIIEASDIPNVYNPVTMEKTRSFEEGYSLVVAGLDYFDPF